MGLFDILAKYHEGILDGLLVTARLSLTVWAIGITLGCVLAILGARHRTTFWPTFSSVSFILSSIPVLVLLMWLHYPAQSLLGVVVHPYWTTLTVLSIVNILAVAGIVQPALLQFPRELLDAGRACGLTPKRLFWSIQLPVLLRQTLPAILLAQVVVMHATLFGSLISLDEVFRAVQRINADAHRPIELYTILAVTFLLVSAPINLLARWLSRRYDVQLRKA